jgi:shikimate dehydrogenase
MTRLFGVMGFPIHHSLSPAMHTAALRALRMDALYTAFDVPPRFLRSVLDALILAGVEGLNVTVPLKERIVPLLDRVDPTAQAVGAVNTVAIRRGRTVGYNTDVAGFTRALTEALRVDGRGRRVLLLGAGGAARAVGWALLALGPARIWVANRTPSRAARLVRWLRAARPVNRSGGAVRPPTEISAVSYQPAALSRMLPVVDLVINATSLGLGTTDPLPVDAQALHRRLSVFDLVYRRPTTAFVQAARRRGALAIDGLPMLLYQGAESLRLWLGRPAPLQAMRRALVEAMRARPRL